LLAPQFPDVNFIIPHLGSFANDWRVQQQVVDQPVRFPNVYGDTSGVRRFDYIAQAVKRAGAQKVLFGPLASPQGRAPQDSTAGAASAGGGLSPPGGNALRLLQQVRVGRGERIMRVEKAGTGNAPTTPSMEVSLPRSSGI